MLFFGSIFLLVIIISDVMKESTVIEIERGNYLEDEQALELVMQVEDKDLYEINIQVESVQYKAEDIEVLYQPFVEELEKIVLGSNSSWNHVTEDLNFAEKIDGYPFGVTWETSDYKILSRTGERIIENFDEGFLVGGGEVVITATVRYLGFEKKIFFFPCLGLSEMEEKELYRREAERYVLEAEEKTREEDYFLLPNQINGKEVVFQEIEEKNYMEWAIFLIIVILGLIWVENDKLNRELDKRRKRSERLYPEVVVKRTLLLCVGLKL